MCGLSRHKTRMLSIYRMLIREAEKFPAYNFRTYALRKVREEFRENRSLTDAAQITEKVQYAQYNLQIIRRQVIIGHLYGCNKNVIEQ